MGIPFEVASKNVKDTDKSAGKALGFVFFMEHTEDDAACGSKKAVKEGTVSKKELVELRGSGEDAVPVCDVQDIKGHGSGTVNGVFHIAGGTEAAVAAVKFTTFIASIHGTAKRWVTAVKHPVNIPNDGRSAGDVKYTAFPHNDL